MGTNYRRLTSRKLPQRYYRACLTKYFDKPDSLMAHRKLIFRLLGIATQSPRWTALELTGLTFLAALFSIDRHRVCYP